MEKLEWCRYQRLMWKSFMMFTGFNTMPACDRQTDGHTSCSSTVCAIHTHHAIKMYSAAPASDYCVRSDCDLPSDLQCVQGTVTAVKDDQLAVCVKTRFSLTSSIRVWLSGLRLYLQSDRDKTLHRSKTKLVSQYICGYGWWWLFNHWHSLFLIVASAIGLQM